jgi:hypothetical protein
MNMADGSNRYPAMSYDKLNEDWGVRAEPITQLRIASELAPCVSAGMTVRGGPLRAQLSDGSSGREIGAVSIVWSQTQQDDGSRNVLGWYESGRG